VIEATSTRRARGPIPWAVLAALYVGAIALGAGSAWVLLRSVSGPAAGGVAVGPWRTSLLTGSPDADLYTRARVALGALLALNRGETMYYLAHVDSDGRALRSACRYRVSGPAPAARWWSVTAYADDHFLFDNPQRRYSLNSRHAVLDPQGRFALVSGPDDAGQAGDGAPWLPTPGDRGLVFALRLYNPQPVLASSPGSLAAPRIERLGECA
jgi:hypothetical protein